MICLINSQKLIRVKLRSFTQKPLSFICNFYDILVIFINYSLYDFSFSIYDGHCSVIDLYWDMTTFKLFFYVRNKRYFEFFKNHSTQVIFIILWYNYIDFIVDNKNKKNSNKLIELIEIYFEEWIYD